MQKEGDKSWEAQALAGSIQTKSGGLPKHCRVVQWCECHLVIKTGSILWCQVVSFIPSLMHGMGSIAGRRLLYVTGCCSVPQLTHSNKWENLWINWFGLNTAIGCRANLWHLGCWSVKFRWSLLLQNNYILMLFHTLVKCVSACFCGSQRPVQCCLPVLLVWAEWGPAGWAYPQHWVSTHLPGHRWGHADSAQLGGVHGAQWQG